jgi:hypothetical protein
MTVKRATDIYVALYCRLIEHGVPADDAVKLCLHMSSHEPTVGLIRHEKERVVEVLAKDVADAYNRMNYLFRGISKVPCDLILAGVNTYREVEQPIGY